jgi:hypothetical protein
LWPLFAAEGVCGGCIGEGVSKALHKEEKVLHEEEVSLIGRVVSEQLGCESSHTLEPLANVRDVEHLEFKIIE